MSQKFNPQCYAVLNLLFDEYGTEIDVTKTKVIPCRPIAATIHRNSYRQADSWEITVPAESMPIDPQFVRAGSAQIYLFQTPGVDSGMTPILPDPPSAEKSALERLKGVADTIAKGLKGELPDRTQNPEPQIAGLIDDISVEYTSDSKLVMISGQDYTAYLMEKQWPPTRRNRPRKIPAGKRIDKHIREWLLDADPSKELEFEIVGLTDEEIEDLPVVGASEVNSNKRGIPISEGTSYWDVIYNTATRHGLIAFVRGLKVILTRPKNFSARHKANPLILAWGHNIQTLEMSRHLGKETVPQIIVKGYDEKNRKGVTVRYPEKALKRKGSAGKNYTEQKYSSKKKKRSKKKTRTEKYDNEYQIYPFW